MTWVYFPIFINFISWHYFFVKPPENSHHSLAPFITATFGAQIMWGLKSSLSIVSNIFPKLRTYYPKLHLGKCVTGDIFSRCSLCMAENSAKWLHCPYVSFSKLTSIAMPKVWLSGSWHVVTAAFHYLPDWILS